MRRRSAVLIASFGLLGAANVHAQRIEGRVTLPDGAPAVRALVEAQRVGAPDVIRALSDESGRFSLGLSGPGRYAVRALRVGYRPTVLPARDIAANESARLLITLGAELVRLGEVRIAADAVCADDWRGDLATVSVWEEARKALQTAQLTAEQDGLSLTISSYQALASDAGFIHPVTRTEYWQETNGVRPFESVPDSVISAEGYAVARATGTIFRAPDFDLLLAPSFATTHCMRLVPASEDKPGAVGLAFEPNRERRRPDIEGVLWIDKETAVLRELEFRYTGVVGSAVGRQGGHVRFMRLSTGQWIVHAWEIRMPRAAESGLSVIGGEVGEVRRGDSVLFTTGGTFDDILPTHLSVVAQACGEPALANVWGMLRGEVVDADGQPAPFSRVRVSWTGGTGEADLNVIADDDGRWIICRVPASVTLRVEARRGSRDAETRVTLAAGERFAEVLLTLRR